MADQLLSREDAVDRFVARLNEELSTQIKLLLEEKHLYQKVKIDSVEQIRVEALRRAPKEAQEWVNDTLTSRLAHQLDVSIGGYPTRVNMEGGPKLYLCLKFPIVRLFCHNCKRKEAFGPAWYQDATNEMLKLRRDEKIGRNYDISNVRVYFIAYQCQYCKGAPEGFLVRKTGWTFSLDGRSPMEHIELPKYIPDKESGLFRDAMIAYHAGKWLAAVFYLRCFIEQFARRQIGAVANARKTGDDIMDAYAQLLPEDKRSHLTSLKHWYDRLSEPMHTADEGAAEKLFDEARQEIEHHFELRQAFRILEK